MLAFDLPRGKKDDGGQGGSWEIGLEATSGSEGPKHMGKEREKHGKEITDRDEELAVLFGMTQGTATRRWIIAVGQRRGGESPLGLLLMEDLFQWQCTSVPH